MKHCLLFILCSIFAAAGFAQKDNTNLLVQSPDGKTVKLVWFLKSGNPEITGFDVKRKEGLEGWVKLNTAPILPGISAKKNLGVVESDNLEQGKLRDKLADLLKAGKLRETDNATYLQKLNSNDKEIQDINTLMNMDYDAALICGFGFVDHTVNNKTDYQYGLFIQGTDILLDKASWNYGEIPDLNVVREITSRSIQGSNGLQIMWTADVAKMKEGYVAGFNIYRQGMRLNEHPLIAVNSKELSEFSWTDKSASASVANQYSISAQSLFGIEGIIKPYTYNPADHPSVYKKAEVSHISSIGYYFKDGINIQWTFPKDYEHFVKGFYVEKDNMPEGYTQVSKLLDPGDRTYIDKTSSPVSGYIRIRVVAVYNDKTVTPGVERLYHYFPMRDPPPPQNVKIKTQAEDKKLVVKLSWDAKMSGDSITEGYLVYKMDPLTNKFTVITEKAIKANSYSYTIQHGVAATHMFRVTAQSVAKTESQPTDTLTVQAPSFELPMPVISRAEPEATKARIQWQYPEVQDLKGFRLYRNKELVADETVIKKTAREFTTGELSPGTDNSFTLVAVSETGLLSDVSQPAQVLMPVLKKEPTDYR